MAMRLLVAERRITDARDLAAACKRWASAACAGTGYTRSLDSVRHCVFVTVGLSTTATSKTVDGKLNRSCSGTGYKHNVESVLPCMRLMVY